jgi:hypothetical protein
VLPTFDVPELNVSSPDVPPSPAFAVRMFKAPLVVARPRPVVRPIAPPVFTVL